jgi:hypothetical protein
MMKADNDIAYRSGWRDGRYGERCPFTEVQAAAERLDYYRGHRAGQEARQHSGKLLKAS